MFSIRAISRSTPRALSRLTSSAIRRPIHKTLFQTSLRQAKPQHAAAFSTAMARREKVSEIDDELVAKLESELGLENRMTEDGTEDDGLNESVKDFLQKSPFEIEDIPGREEVVLTRQFGDETIRVSFSIADLNNLEESDFEDRALDDEENVDSTNGNGAQNQDVKAEPQDPFEDASEDSRDQQISYPARVNVVVAKPEKGALLIEALAQDGMISVEQVYYYSDVSYALDKTAQATHERQEMYAGPPFGNLDEDLQVLFDKYLDERGINTNLALFVPDYIDMKEQKEYVRWLTKVKNFVGA